MRTSLGVKFWLIAVGVLIAIVFLMWMGEFPEGSWLR